MTTIEERAVALLRRGNNDSQATFRSGQLEAIVALVRDRPRVLVIQRPGWGKSSVYSIGARLLRESGAGPTVIIGPLISLMRNQLQAAERMGIVAGTINSTNASEHYAVIKAFTAGELDVLLVAPERLANEQFVNNVLMASTRSIGMFVVDEAHCISDRGHDFRPDHRRIAALLKHFPANLPVLATTATANGRVVEDLQGQLRIEGSSSAFTRSILPAIGARSMLSNVYRNGSKGPFNLKYSSPVKRCFCPSRSTRRSSALLA